MLRSFALLILVSLTSLILSPHVLSARSDSDLQRGRQEMNRGDYMLAERDLKTALADAQKHGDAIRGYLACSALAQLAQMQGQFGTQEQYLLNAFQWRQTVGRPTAPLPALLALESFYRRQKRWDNDIGILQHVIAIWSDAAGADALGLAQYQYKLGQAYRAMHDDQNAEAAFRNALSVFEANGMSDSPAAARAAIALATVLDSDGNSDEAGKLFASAVPRLRSLGEDSPNFTSASNQYAHFLRKIGREDEADAFDVKPRDRQGSSTPRLTSKREPEYTNAARDKKLAGTIVLSLEVDETGHPQNIEVLEPLGLGLDQNAIKAVSAWRFEPATREGHPVKCPAQVEVNFSLL